MDYAPRTRIPAPSRERVEQWIKTWEQLHQDGVNINQGLRTRWAITTATIRRWAKRHNVELPPFARLDRE